MPLLICYFWSNISIPCYFYWGKAGSYFTRKLMRNEIRDADNGSWQILPRIIRIWGRQTRFASAFTWSTNPPWLDKSFPYLNTMGVGPVNRINVFLMFSCMTASSRNHRVCSEAEGPAVGSGAPHTMLMVFAWEDNSSSKSLWAVGKICGVKGGQSAEDSHGSEVVIKLSSELI